MALSSAGPLLVLVLEGALLNALSLASLCVATVSLGGRLRRVIVGLLSVAAFSLAGVEIKLGLLPLTWSVEFLGRGPQDDYEGPGSFRRLSLARRLAIVLAPWAATLLAAVACLGAGRALGSLAHGFYQLLFVLDLRPLVGGALRLVREQPASVSLGVVAAKLTAFHLLPLGGLAGGAVIQELTARPEPSEPSGPSAAWIVGSMSVALFYIGGRLIFGLLGALR